MPIGHQAPSPDVLNPAEPVDEAAGHDEEVLQDKLDPRPHAVELASLTQVVREEYHEGSQQRSGHEILV